MTRTTIGRRLAAVAAAAAVAVFAGCGEEEVEEAPTVPDAQQGLEEGEQEIEENQDQVDEAQQEAQEAIDQAQEALEDPEAREQLEQELQEQLPGEGE